MVETVAVFGGTGATGKHVVALALQKNYAVRMMCRNPDTVEKKANLTVIEGDFENEAAIQETVQGAQYVICVAGGKPWKCTSDMSK